MKKNTTRVVLIVALLNMTLPLFLSTANPALAETTAATSNSNQAAVMSSDNPVLTETNAVLTASGTLSISDVDSAATFVAKKNVRGAYGNFSINAAGAWTYVTRSALDSISEGKSVNDNFTVISADGSKTSVQVTINGTNDAAVLSSASVILKETNAALRATGRLSIKDVDSPKTFVAQSSVAGTNGSFSIDTSGRWSYVANRAFDELNVGQRVSDSFTVSSTDGTTTTVQVTINGTNDAAVLGTASVELFETDTALSGSGMLSISDVDSPPIFAAQSNVAGTNGVFSIDRTGAWTYVANSAFDQLKVGQIVRDSFKVASSDGATTMVKISIKGTNDAAILSPVSVALDETNVPLSTSGKLSISDVDSAQTFAAKNKLAGVYGTFSIDTSGRWTYTAKSAFNELNVGQNVSDSFTVASADGTTTTVQITIHGTNDAAILSLAKITQDETNAPLSVAGTLTIRDVDSPALFVADSNVVGANGTFSIDSSGRWTYLANSAFNNLGLGQSVTDSFTPASVDGTTTEVQVIINGNNDAAVLSPALVVLDETNAPLSASGTLSISDADSPATLVAQSNVVGTNGIFNIDSAGAWNYLANSAFDNLNVGQSVGDSFTVASADGTTTTVQVTINGSNDAAVLNSASVALDETNAPLSTSGTLSISDVDSPLTFVAQSNVVGTSGTFNIDATGAWNYIASSAFDSLLVGQSISDSFTVASADGTTTTVRVTINGSNESAILSSADVVLTETNAILSAAGKLTISDVDSPQTFVAQSKVAGDNGIFNIDSAGRWTYVTNSALDNLNVDKGASDSFKVASSDGTTTTVKITINGTNDAAILSPVSVVLIEINDPLKANGTLSISDVDNAKTFAPQNNVAGVNGMFNVDTTGTWTYLANSAFDNLIADQQISDQFTVASSDGTTTTVQVTIKGTNDAAVIGGNTSVVLTETNEVLSTSGTLSISDADSTAAFVARRNVSGKNGAFNIDTAGAWTYVTYNAHNTLSEGQKVSDSFIVTSVDGTTSAVQVTINGSNDAASLTAASVTLTETNAPLSTSGRLSSIDIDSAMSFVAQSNVAGENGSFSIDTSGRWRYVAKSAFDDLNVGQSVSDSFTVSGADGTTTTVQVTIQGSDDSPSKFAGGWFGGRAGLNRSNLNDLDARSAFTYGIEEGSTWELGILRLGVYGFAEFNTTAKGAVNYSSDVFGIGAKLGYASGNWLTYGKLGYARTNGIDAADVIGASHVHRGMGIEYMFAPRWSVAGEFTSSNGNTIIQNIENKLRNKNITIGLNYYLGVPVPIPARVPPAPRIRVPVPPPAPPAPPAPKPAPVPAPPVSEVWKTLMEDKPVRIEGTNFVVGSAKLQLVTGKKLMKEVVEFAVGNPKANLEVIGYCDSTGTEKLNKKLSLARANSVKKYLIATGITADRITTKGEGSSNPVGDNKTKAGRAQNRRVEIRSVVKEEKKVRVDQPAPAPVPPAPTPPVPVPAVEPASGAAPVPAPVPNTAPAR